MLEVKSDPVTEKKTELGPNTVRLTFLPGGQSVEFEAGQLPYQEHGKRQSILDVAMNFGVHLEHACGGRGARPTSQVVRERASRLRCAGRDLAQRRRRFLHALALRSRSFKLEIEDILNFLPRTQFRRIGVHSAGRQPVRHRA